MAKQLGIALAAIVSIVAASAAAGQELRIGFLNTTTGGGAVIGRHVENGWKLGLETHGWKQDGDKLAGVPTRIFYADDQTKTDVALREAERFLKQDRVHIVAGIVWSHIFLTVQKPVFDAGRMILAVNASPAAIGGKQCNPLFVSSSFMNAGNAEATGEMATKDQVKTVVALAPNYQAGKDNIAGFQRTFKTGRVVETILFRVGETDFQADLAKVRAVAPEALYVFAPGAMGIAFMKQWVTSGLNKTTRLYSIYTIDGVTLPAIGEAAIGATEAGHWNPDLDIPENKRFIAAYSEKFGHAPSYFAVQSYDAVGLIVAGLKRTGGKLDDMKAFALAIRRGPMISPRGTLKFNVNGMIIQPYWRLNVVAGADGKPVIKGGEKIMERADSYWQDCPAEMRH